MALERLYWSDWIIFALFSLGIALLWTIFWWAFQLWRSLETTIKRRNFQSLLGGVAIFSIAFAMCVVAYLSVSSVRPCFSDFVERPGFLFGCYVLFSDELPIWPSNDLVTYVGLALLALIIVCTRFAFCRWLRG
jgi:hypothetical protein